MNTGNLILRYAAQNMTNKEISLVLKKEYNVTISPDAIRKRLNRAGFPLKRGAINETVIKRKIESLLPNLPQTVGYRHMTNLVKSENVQCQRDVVMKILREVDSVGVEFRRRRRIQRKMYRSIGPNFIWHVDGYDKLKPFGFPIHGCIDGLSNDTTSDPGTENAIMGALQCVFRHSASDMFAGIHSYRVVRSAFNQRIEAWWSILRRHEMEWWISFFKTVEDSGEFSKENVNDIYSTRFCFAPLLQTVLDSLVEQWNTHHISRSKHAACPNGKPVVLYMLPEEKGFCECLHPVSTEDLEFAYSQCQVSSRSGSREFDREAYSFFSRRGWQDSLSWQDALYQYTVIRGLELVS